MTRSRDASTTSMEEPKRCVGALAIPQFLHEADASVLARVHETVLVWEARCLERGHALFG